MKSFKAKDGSSKPPQDGGRNPTVDFKDEKRGNATRLDHPPAGAALQKTESEKSRLCYLGHAIMENRNGLAVDLETTLATGTAEREAATAMVVRSVKRGSTLGADRNYDMAGFVRAMRNHGVTPHGVRGNFNILLNQR